MIDSIPNCLRTSDSLPIPPHWLESGLKWLSPGYFLQFLKYQVVPSTFQELVLCHITFPTDVYLVIPPLLSGLVFDISVVFSRDSSSPLPGGLYLTPTMMSHTFSVLTEQAVPLNTNISVRRLIPSSFCDAN